MISFKKSLFASAVAVALITTAVSVDGYDVVVSSASTYDMKRLLRVAAEEAAEEEMAEDSECESLEMAGNESECGSLDMAEDSECEPLEMADDVDTQTKQPPRTDGNAGTPPPTTGDSGGYGTGGTNENKDAGDDECDSLEVAEDNSTDGTNSDTNNGGGNNGAPPPTTPTTSSDNTGDTNSGNVNEKYGGQTSDIDFSGVQGEVDPGTVAPP